MTPALSRRLRVRLRLSALALYWERLWPRLWPAVALTGAFIAIALFDVLPRLPATAHLLVLVVFAGAFVWALAHALPALGPVGRRAARQRLDAAAGERPLAALDDRLALGRDDALATALWRRHQQRMAAAAETLAVRLPAPGLPRHEPWGVRAGVVLLLVIAVAAGGRHWHDRLARAVEPRLGSGGPAGAVEVWITPPSYTSRPPLFLRGDRNGASDAAALQVPAGSRVLARVTGVSSVPRLRIGDRDLPFAALAGDQGAPTAYRSEATVEAGDRLGVYAGLRELAAWPLQVIPDRAPSVDAPRLGADQGNGLLDVGFEVTDDYGVSQVEARIRLSGDADDEPAEELRLALTTAAAGGAVTTGRAFLDVAAHPWAGRKATLTLEATDGIGQSGISPTVPIVMPERIFSHPVAREIVAERRRLIDPSLPVKASVATALTAILADPSRFNGDTVVALGLSVARWRLIGDEADGRSAAVGSVYDLLWDIALRLEDGGIGSAERRLAQAQQQLTEALRAGAPENQIEHLMDALTEALDEYLAAAAAELSRRPEMQMPSMPFGRTLHADALRGMLDRVRELSRAGAREEAQALLNDLQGLLESVRLGLRQGPVSERLRAAGELMQSLRDLEARQRTLLDETYQKLRQQREQRRGGGRHGNEGAAETDALAQQTLRGDLGDLAEKMQDRLGIIPRPLGAADQAMQDAAHALTGDSLSEAVGAQSQAAEALGQAIAEAQQAITSQMGDGIGGFGVAGSDGGGDPFGRPAGGSHGLATGNVGIPERAEIERIQDLLRELRRRAGERDRPGDELDYIKRLLRPF